MLKYPDGKKIAFIIRDDDTSAVTPPAYLKTVYAKAWQLGFPVTLSVVPEIIGSYNLNIPRDKRGSGEVYKLRDTPEVLNFLRGLREQGKIEIAQHGRYHSVDLDMRYPEFGSREGYSPGFLARASEFYGQSEKEISENIRAGKQELESLFAEPMTNFVAPQEYMTPVIWKNLEQLGFLAYSGGVRPRIWEQLPLSSINKASLLKLIAARLVNKPLDELGEYVVPLSRIPILPATYRHYWSVCQTEVEMEASVDRALSIFAKKYERGGGYFLLLTHYWEYFGDWQTGVTQKYQLAGLERILEAVDKYEGVWKCTLSQYAKWRMGS